MGDEISYAFMSKNSFLFMFSYQVEAVLIESFICGFYSEVSSVSQNEVSFQQLKVFPRDELDSEKNTLTI